MSTTNIDIASFNKAFSTDKKCRTYLEATLWNGTQICPHCNSTRTFKLNGTSHRKGLYKCSVCRKPFTVTVGTIFERSHIPLNKWIFAMYLLVTARKGISSLQLSKEIGITQKSAWFMLQRLREACKEDTFLLSGIVEADETYIGGKEENKHESKKSKDGRGPKGKSIVLGMRKRDGDTVIKAIKDTKKETIHTEIKNNIAPDSILCTDEHASYKKMEDYLHFTVNHSVKEFVNGMAHINGIESVWAILKRGYHGIYHHFTEKHLQRYISEFTFRLNEGNCKIPSMTRVDSLFEKTIGKTLTYNELIFV